MDSTYNHQYSDFTGGISTLPLNKRTPNQTSEILNCLVTEQGVRRRNPFTNFNANTQTEDCLAFSFNHGKRDYLLVLSPYHVSITYNGVKYNIYDDRGVEVTIDKLTYHNGVNVMDSWGFYPKEVHIRDAFSVTVVKDIIFIANKHKRPRMRRVKYPSASMEHFYGFFFKESTTVDGGYHYYLTVEEDGVDKQDYQYKDTIELCQSLGAVSPKMADYDNVVIGKWTQGMKVAMSDSNGNQATQLLHRQIVRFEDLPLKIGHFKRRWFYWHLNDGEDYYEIYEYNEYSEDWELTERTREEPKLDKMGIQLTKPSRLIVNHAPDFVPPWIILEVTEGNSDDIGGYIVCYNNGEWMECSKWGDEVEINYITFPLQLQYRDDTRFTLAFSPLKEKRTACNNPTFIGDYIQSMFYYKGRIGVATKNDISLSAVVTDDQLNFFKTTMRADIVSDTLNYGISTSSVSDILMVLPSQFGLFIIATDGIYANTFNGVVSQDTNTIGRVTEEKIVLPIVMEDTLYYLTGGSLKAIIQGKPQRVGEHFRGKLDNVIDVAVHQPTRQIFFLDGNKKTIWVIKVLTTENGDYYSLGKWTRFFDIHAIEVAKDSLVIVQDSGIYASNLTGQDATHVDVGGGATYRSEVTLPKQILRTNAGYNSLLYKYVYKRLELFLGYGEMAIELYRDNTLVERIEEQEVNVMQGTNQDTTIKLTSIDDKQFNLHFAESTLYVERGNYKNI